MASQFRPKIRSQLMRLLLGELIISEVFKLACDSDRLVADFERAFNSFSEGIKRSDMCFVSTP